MSEAASSSPSSTTVRSHPLLNAMDRFFHISERGSSFRCEILAGLTTFSTLSYILVVNPMIMSASGMDYGALITATAVVGALFTIMMGLWTNYPLAMAPGMGVNALLAYQVCQKESDPNRNNFFKVSRKTVDNEFPESGNGQNEE